MAYYWSPVNVPLPNTTDPNAGALPTFTARTTCPDVTIWIAIAVMVGIVVGRAWKK